MTNREALQAYINNYPLKSDSIDLALINANITNPTDTYAVADQQKIETALVGLLLILVTNPKSISELDFQLTSQDVDGLLKLRSIYMAKWNIPEEITQEQSYVQDVTHLWGTTNY